jgi:hypothetical protein
VFPLDRGLLMGAKSTDIKISPSVTDILFFTKLQKGKPSIKDLPLSKKDITTIFYRYEACV